MVKAQVVSKREYIIYYSNIFFCQPLSFGYWNQCNNPM